MDAVGGGGAAYGVRRRLSVHKTAQGNLGQIYPYSTPSDVNRSQSSPFIFLGTEISRDELARFERFQTIL